MRWCQGLGSGLGGRPLFLPAFRKGRMVVLKCMSAVYPGSHLEFNLRFPLASLGAVARQLLQSFDEQGMS